MIQIGDITLDGYVVTSIVPILKTSGQGEVKTVGQCLGLQDLNTKPWQRVQEVGGLVYEIHELRQQLAREKLRVEELGKDLAELRQDQPKGAP